VKADTSAKISSEDNHRQLRACSTLLSGAVLSVCVEPASRAARAANCIFRDSSLDLLLSLTTRAIRGRGDSDGGDVVTFDRELSLRRFDGCLFTESLASLLLVV
jgi:hypothetical protein